MALTNPDRLVSMLRDGANTTANHFGERERSREMEIESMSPRSLPRRTSRSIQAEMHDMCIEGSLFDSSNGQAGANRSMEDDRIVSSSRRDHAANSWGLTVDDWEKTRSDLETSAIHGEPLADRAGT